MNRNLFKYCFGVLMVCLLQSCTLFKPNAMFVFPVDYEYVSFDTIIPEETVLQIGDRIDIDMISNNNYGYINSITFNYPGRVADVETKNTRSGFLIGKDSLVNLPVIGRKNLVGLKISQAQDTLLKWYGKYIQDPFLELNVTNRFIYVFTGLSKAREVPLNRENMTLLQLIANMGGLGERQKSTNLKIIRGGLQKPQVMELDLSNFENLKKSEIILQSGDYIVIDERINFLREGLSNIAIVSSLFSTAFSIFYISSRL